MNFIKQQKIYKKKKNEIKWKKKIGKKHTKHYNVVAIKVVP